MQTLGALYALVALGAGIGLSTVSPPKNAPEWAYCVCASILWPATLMALLILRVMR